MNKKTVKITKGAHDFNGHTSSYNVEILNSFNPDLQIKDNEPAIKNKLKKLLSKIKTVPIRGNISFSV